MKHALATMQAMIEVTTAELADKVREVLALRGAGQPDVVAQRVDQQAELRVDLLGEDALQDEAKARPHLPRLAMQPDVDAVTDPLPVGLGHTEHA